MLDVATAEGTTSVSELRAGSEIEAVYASPMRISPTDPAHFRTRFDTMALSWPGIGVLIVP